MYYRVTGQEIYAEWKEKELRVKELVKKIYKIEGEIEFKDVKTVLSKKLGYAEDRIKAIKFKNSPAIHKKVESIFSDNSEIEFDEKIEKIISEEVKEIEKDDLEKQAIELMEVSEEEEVIVQRNNPCFSGFKGIVFEEKFEIVEIPAGESDKIISDSEKFFCNNKKNDYCIRYSNQEKEIILNFNTTKEEVFVEFIESFIFKCKKKVKLEKRVIKTLNEFSKFLLEIQGVWEGKREIMCSEELVFHVYSFEEIEEKYDLEFKLEF